MGRGAAGEAPRAWYHDPVWRSVVFLAVVLLAISYRRLLGEGEDFGIFWRAGAYVWETGEFFDDKGTARYPPTFQAMAALVGALPLWLAAALWLLGSMGALASLPGAFHRLGAPPPREQWPAWLAALPFLADNFLLGQTGPFLLALASWGMVWAHEGRAARGGASLALAAWIKVFPASLLYVPAVLGRLRGSLVGVAAATAVCLGLVLVIVGPREGIEDARRWYGEVRQEQSPSALIEVGRSLRYNNQGLAVTLARTLTHDFAYDPEQPWLAAKGSVQLARLPLPVAFGIYGAVVATLGAGLLALGIRARTRAAGRDFLGLYALTACVALAVSPLVWTHYFCWTLPALVYLVDRRRLVLGLAAAGAIGLLSIHTRALGFHMGMTLVLYGLVAAQLWREVGRGEGSRS